MITRTIFIFFSLLLLALQAEELENLPAEVVFAQRKSGLPEGVESVSVPLLGSLFDVFFVDVQVNGKPVKLLLDTGATGTVLSPEAAKKVGLQPVEGAKSTMRSSIGKYETGQIAQAQRIDIGGAWTTKEIVGIHPLPKAFVDGVIGLTTLVDWDLQIDPVAKKLSIFPKGKAPTLDGEVVLKMAKEVLDSNPESHRLISINVPMTVGKKALQGILDTGFSGTINLGYTWMKENEPDVIKNLPAAQARSQSLSGVSESRDVKLPILHFASDELRNFPVEVTQGEAENHDPKILIGCKLLSHYIITISFSKDQVRLKPLGTVQDLTKISKRVSPGMSFDFTEDGRMFILSLKPDGIAAKAGLKVRDEILEMEGIVMQNIKPEQFKALKKLTTVTVRYRRGKEDPAEVTLILEKTE